MTTDRLLAFSDGVFAIAITLLVLDVRLPALGSGPVDEELPRAMLAMWPKAGAYALSFFVVAVYWLGHHRLFEHIQRFDNGLAWLNVVVLLLVAVLPVPTSILAAYGDTPAATILYAVAAAAAGFATWVLWWHACRAGLVDDDGARRARYIGWRILVVPIVFAVSIPVAVLVPTPAKLIWIGIAVWRIILRRMRTANDVA